MEDRTALAQGRIGARVGDFELTALLDVGFLGASYRAQDANGQIVALELIHPELTGGVAPILARWVARVERFDLPNVVLPRRVEAAADGTAFVVSPLLSGESLRRFIARRGTAVAPSEALRVIEEAALTLAPLHALGEPHGALAPASIFLRDDGGVALLAVGQAEVRARAAQALGLRDDPNMEAFTAPEAAHDPLAADELSDLWSLASVLFFMLTGRPARTGTRVRSLPTLCPRAPAELVAVLQRALAVDRAARFPTAKVLAAALGAARDSAEVANLFRLEIAPESVRAADFKQTVDVSSLTLTDPADGTATSPPTDLTLAPVEETPTVPLDALPGSEDVEVDDATPTAQFWHAAPETMAAAAQREHQRLLALLRFDTTAQLEDCWQEARAGAADAADLELAEADDVLVHAFAEELAGDHVDPERRADLCAAVASDPTLRGDALVTLAPLRRWLETESYSVAATLELIARVLDGLTGPEQEREDAKTVTASALVSADLCSRLLSEAASTGLDTQSYRRLTAVIDALGAPHVQALAAALPGIVDPNLHARVLHRLEQCAAGQEAAIAAAIPKASVPVALQLVRLIGQLDTLGARRALEAALASPHAAVRIEALGQIEGVSGVRLRAELQRQLDEQADEGARVLALREINDHAVRAAGPHLALRVKSSAFSALSYEEKRVTLNALATLLPPRAEAAAVELLGKERLFKTRAHEETRLLCVEVLARVGSSEDARDTLEELSQKRWGASEELRAAATKALERLRHGGAA